jgi:DNA-binding NtrC family response regulator
MARILIVDDEELIRNLLRQMLEREGYEVVEAGNGKIALQVFRQQPADLIITDIIMPEKEGLETITEFRKTYPNVKIIGISGGGRIDSKDYLFIAQRLGANRTLAKPFEWSDMLTAIKDLLNS